MQQAKRQQKGRASSLETRRGSRGRGGQRRPLPELIDRLLYGAVRFGGIVPFETLATLSLPLCEVEFGGESHYLMRIEYSSSGKPIYITACGGELPERPAPTSEPLCRECCKVVENWSYETS